MCSEREEEVKGIKIVDCSPFFKEERMEKK
jgi:hypothetical protein